MTRQVIPQYPFMARQMSLSGTLTDKFLERSASLMTKEMMSCHFAVISGGTCTGANGWVSTVATWRKSKRGRLKSASGTWHSSLRRLG